MLSVQETADLGFWLQWPPKYAESPIKELRQILHDRFMASPNMRIDNSDCLDLAKKACPKSGKFTPSEVLKELTWDVFCAINHV